MTFGLPETLSTTDNAPSQRGKGFLFGATGQEESSLRRWTCRRGTWGARRWKETRASRSAEIGLGFGPIGPSKIGLGV
ncbi:hypothetical protein ERO13_A13G124900v2 [Gossypium hirsutum]|uniref:Uncharacterized protein n=1 Tax=Gossypium mustelinum TaxID=34275 RepID=A0A5D2WI18_GOSMU|nr:hypothetical protein ERO13_A13G124900v2 [Gossypium hirsutum]TYJ01316.1 hypothetical protein E1A91_A13G145400v1 [Gossypium mustelinum]